jgi:Tat protein translocase TatB subunit
MFGIGLPEMIIILVVALLVVGPSKLPELARTLGKAFTEFRRMADDVKETFEEEVMMEETAKTPEATAEAKADEKNQDEAKQDEATKAEAAYSSGDNDKKST